MVCIIYIYTLMTGQKGDRLAGLIGIRLLLGPVVLQPQNHTNEPLC